MNEIPSIFDNYPKYKMPQSNESKQILVCNKFEIEKDVNTEKLPLKRKCGSSMGKCFNQACDAALENKRIYIKQYQFYWKCFNEKKEN